ncbi:tape measure protein [Polyangium spumosum]|uniref:Tape measure protein n=1 Tax=Polyangium spumosum TaxID=889282 RepID=A0A6N7Q6C2_9BACT|nr:tape measure protein [Polyangium spumosum]MRG97844.1 tape measure protein [Polyangium spumosum]
MTVSEKLVLREDVARPAAKAAASVERLAGALGELGAVEVDAQAAAKIERTAKAAAAAQDRATEAAKRAAAVREGATKTEAKAREAAERVANATREAEDKAAATAKKAAALREEATKASEKAEEAAARAARLRETGITSEKADREAARAAAKAARLRASADRAEEAAREGSAAAARAQSSAERHAQRLGEKAARQRIAAERAEATAKKRAATAERAQSNANKAKSKAEEASAKRVAKAKKDADKAAAREAKKLPPGMSKTEKRLLDSIHKFNPAQERREAMLEKQLRKMREGARVGVDEPSKEGAGGGWETLKQGAKAAALAEIASRVASAGARAALDLGSAALDAAAFREDATRALGVLLKSKSAADNALRIATQTADFIGQGRRETLGQFVDLLGKGFDTTQVDRIVRSIADLGTVNPSANVDGIVRAMGKIKAQGYLQGDELAMLTEAGLAADKVYGKLAERLGKSLEEVKRMQGAGKLGAADTIEAILAAINELSGGRAAGLAARAKSLEDITGLLGRLRAIPGNLLMDLDVTPGMRAFKSFVGGVLDSLDPSGPRWGRITGALGRVINSAFGGLFNEQDPGKFIDRVVAKMEQAEPIISAVVSGFRTGFGGVLGVFEKLDSLSAGPFGELAKVLGIEDVPWIELVAKGVGLIAGVAGVALGVVGILAGKWASFVGSIYAGVLATYGAIVTFLEWVGDSFSGEGLAEAGASAGTAIVDGLVGSIRAGALAVAAAVKAMAGGAISTAKRTLGIASPSRVFEGIGWNMAGGAEVGITGGAGRVVRAAEAMAFAATRAANDNIVTPSKAAGVGGSGIASSSGARAGRGGVYSGERVTIHVEKIEIVIQGSATERDGEAVARGLWAELQRLAEEAA